eukprot:10410713-Alexandrium_andersonii.AAC.1
MWGPFGRAPYKAASVGRNSPHVQSAMASRSAAKLQRQRGGEGRVSGNLPHPQVKTSPRPQFQPGRS